MIKRGVVVILFFLLCAVSFPPKAHAAMMTGGYLLKICSVDNKGRELVKGGKVACQSYIAGVIDYHNMLRSMDLTSDMNFCIPEKVTLNEIHLRVLSYLYKHIKLHRKFIAAPGVAMALFSLYPCR